MLPLICTFSMLSMGERGGGGEIMAAYRIFLCCFHLFHVKYGGKGGGGDNDCLQDFLMLFSHGLQLGI